MHTHGHAQTHAAGAYAQRAIQPEPPAWAPVLGWLRRQVTAAWPRGKSTKAAADAAAQTTHAALQRAGEQMLATIGIAPYPVQYEAARLMLQGHLVEMATGEGKTVAAALAAAAAALLGTPVKLLTANDYLVQRDHDTMTPFYAALGLRCGCVLGRHSRAERDAAYRADIVYGTARELVFDYLRDHLALGGERDPRVLRARSVASGRTHKPLLPGLQLAIVDEADSILLDEAGLPLILAAPAAALDVEPYQLARRIAAGLLTGRDHVLHVAQRRAELTTAGCARVRSEVQLAACNTPCRLIFEWVEAALAAELFYIRDRDYVVGAAGLQIIDEVTGRIAEGRQWLGALHTMVELKEGLQPAPPTVTAAQTTYQRFFPRWLRLAGMSGTLHEARGELQSLYGCRVLPVPLSQPDRRRWLGRQMFISAAQKWPAIAQRVAAMVAAGRPVLVGTDSVASSRTLAALLSQHGIEHQVLNAVQDADEAAAVARAGQAGMVTVATNIAGRGTDIRLDDAARAAGGLHVILAVANRSRRIDRQLIGRAARHGDPGSAESLLALDEPQLLRTWPACVRRLVARSAGVDGRLPSWAADSLLVAAQRRAEWNDQRRRHELRRSDRGQTEAFGFAGPGE